MKKFLKYGLAIVLLSVLQLSYASNETKGNEVGDSKEDQKQELQQTLEKPDSQPEVEPLDELSNGSWTSGNEEPKADSIIDDSVSKYNFILYFLYKFKYEEE